MRRPTRTRRLSIVAISSLLAFVGVASAGVRSFWIADRLSDSNRREIGLSNGCAFYLRAIPAHPFGAGLSGHFSINVKPDRHAVGVAVWGFRATKELYGPANDTPSVLINVVVPLWPLLLLLLTPPVLWLIARPANAPAFPVVTRET